MYVKKILVLIAAGVLLTTPALAGNIPEFDVVGFDCGNCFNDGVKDLVVENNLDPYGIPINYNSFWKANLMTTLQDGSLQNAYLRNPNGLQLIEENPGWGENFISGSGACFPDPCFGVPQHDGRMVDSLFPWGVCPEYGSVLTDTWNPGWYEWWIILQMKPESDIDLNIRDCVLKHNAAWIYGPEAVWVASEQTGRYRASSGELMFVQLANPKITVTAYPGPFAEFHDSYILDARVMPSLFPLPLNGQFYTSKGIWEEGIVIAMPETGNSTTMGSPCFYLKQGDQIRVRVDIPIGHPADIYYGPDNVSLQYIGICGTIFTTEVFPNCPGGYDLENDIPRPPGDGFPVGCDDDRFLNCDDKLYGCW